MRAIVLGSVIAACGWSAKERTPEPPRDRAAGVDVPVKPPVDPIEALVPTDDDAISWLVPGRIQLEAGGAAIEGPGGNRPIEVKLIDEQGSMVRVALQLPHVRFSVWSDRQRLYAVIARAAEIAAFAGGSPPGPKVMLRAGAKVRRLARKEAWTQIRYIGGVSTDGWVREDALVSSWPRSELPSSRRRTTGLRTMMASPGTVIRGEPTWTARKLAVMANSHFVEVVKDHSDGWSEVSYGDGELTLRGFVGRRDPPARAHRFADPEHPLAKTTPNAKLASGTCLYARPGGEPIGYVVDERHLEVGDGESIGWWSVAVDTPWGPITFVARGPDVPNLERCAPAGSVPAPAAAPPPSVP